MYIVMRCEEDMYHSDYQCKTSIIGIRNVEEEAIDLLKKASELKHEGEKPISGRFNSKGTIGIEYGDTLITDKFWIENRNIHDFDEYCFFHPIE